MSATKIETYRIDGDQIDVIFTLDTFSGAWIGDYPFFEEEPRITPSGRPWRNVTHDNCPFAAGAYSDCGTCPYLIKQASGDLVGVCFHEALRKE